MISYMMNLSQNQVFCSRGSHVNEFVVTYKVIEDDLQIVIYNNRINLFLNMQEAMCDVT